MDAVLLALILAIGSLSPTRVFAAQEQVSAAGAAKFVDDLQNLTERLTEDYRDFLEAYYEIKKRSSDPTEFTVALAHSSPGAETAYGIADTDGMVRKTKLSMDEFSYEEYRKYRNIIDADPKLVKNEFLRRLRVIGFGNANDVFQRVGGEYAAELPSVRREWLIEYGQSAAGVALERAKTVFNEVSAKAGYTMNYKTVDPKRLASFLGQLRSSGSLCTGPFGQISLGLRQK